MSGGDVARPSPREVVFSRLIAAPVPLVWELWSNVRHLHEWFGPTGFTATTQEFTFAPGGVWRLTMHGPDGTDYPTRIVFRDIVPTSRIVYDNTWSLPGAPLDFTVVVSFAAEGTGTRLTLHMTFSSEAATQIAIDRYGVLSGGVETFDRLGRYARERVPPQ